MATFLEYTCGYGNRPLRWFVCSLAIVAFLGVLYAWCVPIQGISGCWLQRLGLGLYYSLGAFTTLGTPDLLPGDDGLVRLLTVAEATTGYVMLGVLVGWIASRVGRLA